MKSSFAFCLYGFVRNAPDHTFDFSSYPKYAYCPKIKYEDKQEETSLGEFQTRFGEDYCNVFLYENYDRSKFTNLVKSLNVRVKEVRKPSHDGIFSYFYHVKKVLEYYLSKKPNSDPDDIIILMRSDISVDSIDLDSIANTLEEFEVKVQGMGKDVIADKYFCFKRKYIKTFINLYDSYKDYLVKFYDKTTPSNKKPKHTFPEYIFWYHITNNNLKIKNKEEDFVFKFKHICNPYCKHKYLPK